MLSFRLLLIAAAVVIVTAQLKWRQLHDGNGTAPPGRMNHAIGYDSIRNRVIIFGGQSQGSIVDDTWSYDLNTNTWTEINATTGSEKPQKRFSMVYGVSHDGFYISTGEGPNKLLYDDVWKFNLSTNTWKRLDPTGKKPDTIYGAAGGFYSNSSTKLFLTHGFSTAVRYANTLVYDILTNHWTEIFPDKSPYLFGHPNERCLHGGTMVAEDELVMYGGCASGGGTGGACPGFDSWLFSESKESWTRLDDCATPRNFPSVVLLPVVKGQRRVVLYGGEEKNSEVLQVDKADPDQVAVLNVNAEEWSLRRAGGDIPGKRVGPAMASHPNGALMFGGSSFNDMYLLEGDTEARRRTPKHSQSCKKPFAGLLNLIMLHGVFMVIGWGILLQAGAFIARYFRHKNPTWFHLHRICQVSGLLFALVGFICGIRSVRFDHFKFAHGGIGLAVMIIGLLQPLNAIIRPHKDPNLKKTMKRKVWEYVHINFGRIALILGVVNISLGILLGQGREAHLIAWHVYVALFVLMYVVMEAKLIQKKISGKSENIEMR